MHRAEAKGSGGAMPVSDPVRPAVVHFVGQVFDGSMLDMATIEIKNCRNPAHDDTSNGQWHHRPVLSKQPGVTATSPLEANLPSASSTVLVGHCSKRFLADPCDSEGLNLGKPAING